MLGEPKKKGRGISFEETSTLGRGRYIQVKSGPFIIGRIEFSRDGRFRYFEPKENELNPVFVEDDLEELKGKIKTRRLP